MSSIFTLSIVQSALELGFIYSLVALALFISFTILNIADLSTDGCFTLGCAVGAMVTLAGHPVLALFETAGQFAYIYALADEAHVALSAPIISAYCAASVLWSRIFLKEKLSWKHYVMIALVVIGIVMIGIFDI